MELTAGWTDSEDLYNIFLPPVRCLWLTEALSPTPALSGLYHGLGLYHQWVAIPHLSLSFLICEPGTLFTF